MEAIGEQTSKRPADLVLSATLDMGAVETLHPALDAIVRANRSVIIDAREVERVHGGAVQMLWAFQRHLEARGLHCRWRAPSDRFCLAWKQLGLPELERPTGE